MLPPCPPVFVAVVVGVVVVSDVVPPPEPVISPPPPPAPPDGCSPTEPQAAAVAATANTIPKSLANRGPSKLIFAPSRREVLVCWRGLSSASPAAVRQRRRFASSTDRSKAADPGGRLV